MVFGVCNRRVKSFEVGRERVRSLSPKLGGHENQSFVQNLPLHYRMMIESC